MSSTVRTHTEPDVPWRIAAEAARWIARLHGPQRSRRMELACLRWQARSHVHRVAFERCTATWDEVPALATPAAGVTAADAAAAVALLLGRWTRSGPHSDRQHGSR